jgi:hypothetical protein
MEINMRRIFFIVCLCLLLLLGACGSGAQPELASASPTPTEDPGADPDGPGSTAKPTEPAQTPAATESKSRLYDPSIFVIEASGSWRDELAPEYYANYECEIYLHKIDANDNREVAGSYDGVFWMKTTLDTSGFIEKTFGDAPIELSFDAGGEAVCDNLAISLHAEDDKAWVNYSIMGEDGNPLPLTQDTPVAKGSFVAVAKQVYLEAHASGAQGEKVDYSSNAGQGDVFDVNYVIHVQPDSMENGTERKVTIHLSGEGFSITIDGVMRRLPGYLEDVSAYYSSSGYQDSAWRHLQ